MERFIYLILSRILHKKCKFYVNEEQKIHNKKKDSKAREKLNHSDTKIASGGFEAENNRRAEYRGFGGG